MRIKKSYHFHASHRNQALQDKCYNIHGHSYHMDLYFEVQRQEGSSITILFGHLDEAVAPLLEELDHAFLIDSTDILYGYLRKGEMEGVLPAFKFFVLNEPTSVENMAFALFGRLLQDLPIVQIDLKETTTSTILYTSEDYQRDLVMKGFVAEGQH